MRTVPKVTWVYDPNHDTRDGNAWSRADIDDLEFAMRKGATIEEAASLLCRQGAVDEVRRKAEELGLIESVAGGR